MSGFIFYFNFLVKCEGKQKSKTNLEQGGKKNSNSIFILCYFFFFVLQRIDKKGKQGTKSDTRGMNTRGGKKIKKIINDRLKKIIINTVRCEKKKKNRYIDNFCASLFFVFVQFFIYLFLK